MQRSKRRKLLQLASRRVHTHELKKRCWQWKCMKCGRDGVLNIDEVREKTLRGSHWAASQKCGRSMGDRHFDIRFFQLRPLYKVTVDVNADHGGWVEASAMKLQTIEESESENLVQREDAMVDPV